MKFSQSILCVTHIFLVSLLFGGQLVPLLVLAEDASMEPGMAVLPDIVMTGNGPIRGKAFQSRNGRSYTGFLGIPYSNSSETKRFQTAAPLLMPWDGVRDAMEFGPPCIQYDSIAGMVKGEEDCLTLNVFTPVMVRNISQPAMTYQPLAFPHWMPILNDTEPRTFVQMNPVAMPVVVFIHGGLGGEFQEGSSSDFGTGKFFMDEDVVLVTLNYRLGPFGFLSTGDGLVLGNMGLKDQVLALEFLRQNIMFFGGDPYRVTIFGSISPHFMMMSPIAQGLFHRAVSLSGTSLDPGAFNPNPVEMTNKLGELFGCPVIVNSTNSMELVSCLRGKDHKEIAEKSSKEFKRWGKDFRIPFPPSYETVGQIPLEGYAGEPFPVVFLPPLSYAEHLNSGSFNRIPWLIGANKEEGLLQALPLLKDGKLLEELNSDWNRIAPNLFMYGDKIPTESLDAISDEIRKFYFRDTVIGPEVKDNLTNLFSDLFILRGMSRAARSQAAKGQTVYPFLFDVMGTSSSLAKFGITDVVKGPTNGDALQYLFDMTNGMENKFEMGSELEKVSKSLVRLLVNFGKLGIPLEEMGVWEPLTLGVSDSPMFWHHISSEKSMSRVSDTFLDRFQFWDYITSKYGV